MGCYVATDADLSLRLVALAPSEPNFRKAEPHACGGCPTREELRVSSIKAFELIVIFILSV
jgi:hypothetical protein